MRREELRRSTVWCVSLRCVDVCEECGSGIRELSVRQLVDSGRPVIVRALPRAVSNEAELILQPSSPNLHHPVLTSPSDPVVCYSHSSPHFVIIRNFYDIRNPCSKTNTMPMMLKPAGMISPIKT